MPKINFHAKLLPNHCYHIYNHAVGTEDLFKQPRNYHFFLDKWNKYITPYFANYAFCLMPNHFHFLVKSKPITQEIQTTIKDENTQKSNAFINNSVEINVFYESQFKRFFNSYTNSINRQEKNRHGSLFKAKFKRTLVDNREKFMYYIQYIHHNPIHHGFSDSFLDWQYSSYPAYFMETKIKELSKQPVLNLFQNETNTTLQNFINSHKNFKENFGR